MDEQNSPPKTSRQSNNMPVIAGVIVLVLIAGGVWFIKGTSPQTAMPDQSTQTAQATSAPMMSASSGGMATDTGMASGSTNESNVKEFTVTGSNYKFEPATLTVNKGDKVKITFKNSGGFHDFVIDEFNVKTKTIPTGAEDTVEFTADKTGTFQYYCSVANHRAMGMVGTLTVE